MYNASMQAVMKIKDHMGNTNTDIIDYKQKNKDIEIKIDNNGQHRQYNLTTDDVGALMDNLNSSNLEQRLLQLGKAISTKKTRKHKHKKHSKSHRRKSHRPKKHRKTRKDKGMHHRTHKKRRVQTRTPTPYPNTQL